MTECPHVFQPDTGPGTESGMASRDLSCWMTCTGISGTFAVGVDGIRRCPLNDVERQTCVRPAGDHRYLKTSGNCEPVGGGWIRVGIEATSVIQSGGNIADWLKSDADPVAPFGRRRSSGKQGSPSTRTRRLARDLDESSASGPSDFVRTNRRPCAYLNCCPGGELWRSRAV